MLLTKSNKNKPYIHIHITFPRDKTGHFLLHLGFQIFSRSKALAEKPTGTIWVAVLQQTLPKLNLHAVVRLWELGSRFQVSKHAPCCHTCTNCSQAAEVLSGHHQPVLFRESHQITNRWVIRQCNKLHWDCSHRAKGQHLTRELALEK